MANGVLIFQGMKLGFLPGDSPISLNEDGENSTKAILSTAYNVIPIWLKAAHDHLKQSKLASEKIIEDWSENPELQKELLVRELIPSIQVFVSCGIALDALYDTLRPHAKISQQEIQAWKNRGTSREKQIIEVIRRTFKLKNDILKNFSDCIVPIIKYRNKAVHPSLELENACMRPDIRIAVDWKFSVYCYSNAERILTNTINMIVYLYDHKTGTSEIDESISNIIDALEELNIVQRRL
ncbi:hypothetical protein CA11_28140 [Gimesia maris]|uniref:hypothetical protein n=1 Tax=Gimesia maris TaxID=122 RepID=UPI00118D3E32|nr:hypothetical protein [Gimesia maris]QDU15001.1 hypothetical protein CA11_28140 [Gimesia maris]